LVLSYFVVSCGVNCGILGKDQWVCRLSYFQAEVNKKKESRLIQVVPWIQKVLPDSLNVNRNKLQAVYAGKSHQGNAKQDLVCWSGKASEQVHQIGHKKQGKNTNYLVNKAFGLVFKLEIYG